MKGLDKLSYTAYGNLVLGVLISLAILFNVVPFSLIGLILCILQIPIYLFARARFKEPIHANGLNICFVLTILFYILVYLIIKVSIILNGELSTFIMSSSITVLCCFLTSTKSSGKLFFGYKKHNESKYETLITYIKYNGLEPSVLEAEERLKTINTQEYLIYKRKFREDKTFKEINEEFGIDNARIVEILDKVYYYMIGALKI